MKAASRYRTQNVLQQASCPTLLPRPGTLRLGLADERPGGQSTLCKATTTNWQCLSATAGEIKPSLSDVESLGSLLPVRDRGRTDIVNCGSCRRSMGEQGRGCPIRSWVSRRPLSSLPRTAPFLLGSYLCLMSPNFCVVSFALFLFLLWFLLPRMERNTNMNAGFVLDGK